MLKARRVRKPSFALDEADAVAAPNHAALTPVLETVSTVGVWSLPSEVERLHGYVADVATVDPNALHRDDALALWINLYNAGALIVAGTAAADRSDSVLRVPGGFSEPLVRIDGEALSLDAIEHGKIRRFGDPRIHGALVCGSVSCPTLRATPFIGDGIDAQLDAQMRAFVTNGGGSVDQSAGILTLSRVFKWYGRDFTSTNRMPTIIPAGSRKVASAVANWFSPSDADYIRQEKPKVAFASYDWALGCSIA